MPPDPRASGPTATRTTLLLLVEDDAILALLTRTRLESYGFAVETAASGEAAAIRAVSEPLPDLVIMDIDLGPGIDGTVAARRILDQRDVPIVFLTMHQEPEWVALVKGISRYGYVLKDSGEFVLAETVNLALELFAARQRLQGALDRLELAVTTAGLGIWTYWVESGRLQWNAEQCRIYGISPEEFSESPDAWRALVFPDDLKVADERFAAVLQGTEVYDVRYRIRRKDGEIRHILASGKPIRDSDGRIRELTGINLDTTDCAEPRH